MKFLNISEAVSEIQKHEFISDVIPASISDDRNNISINDKVILIIEDDMKFAKSLVAFTRKNNYKAVVAVRGDEGIEFAAEISSGWYSARYSIAG